MKSCSFKIQELMFGQYMALLRKAVGEKKIRARTSEKSHPVSEGGTAVFVMLLEGEVRKAEEDLEARP